MSARKQRWYDKMRVYIKFFKKDLLEKSGVLVTCSYCNSHDVSFNAGFDEQETETTIKYIGSYQCKNCGAKCSQTQIWRKKEN